MHHVGASSNVMFSCLGVQGWLCFVSWVDKQIIADGDGIMLSEAFHSSRSVVKKLLLELELTMVWIR